MIIKALYSILFIFIISLCACTNKDSVIPCGVGEVLAYDTVNFNTSDGFIIHADLYLPQNELKNTGKLPVIIMIPMLGQTRSTYNPLIPEITKKGYSVIALDTRGHGDSVIMEDGIERTYQTFGNQDWLNLPKDIDAAIAFIAENKDLDSKRVGIIGASIGANSAIVSASKHPRDIIAVIALSPGLDYHGLKPADAYKSLKIPVYLLASEKDKYSSETVKKLYDMNNDKAKIEVFAKGDHGTKMFTTNPEIFGKITNWLTAQIPLRSGK